ncbi:hypothetical protein [Endozoicomonas sp. 4G]|uniref:hypothetical protein n=1 Tax=Endozoicomonas sp. 4G TaxID=2872754 RepID=UPI002078FDF0|nr:hypothetical protein [Endozoicomonas sp. 4G]
MLSKKTLILTLFIAFSVHCSNGCAQENRLPLRFAQAVSKALINAPKPFIGVLSIKRVFVTGIEEESEAIEWWELQVHSRAASDDSAYSEDSDSEDSSTSDESSDKRSNENEDEANAESDVQHVTTTFNPFRVPNEISQYCATLALKKIKEEPVSDSEILTGSEVDVTKVDAAKHQCDHKSCNYSADLMSNLNRHKQIHLSADQRPKLHQCDHEGCNYNTYYSSDLKRHKQTHLPADQRLKVHWCDSDGCNYSSDRVSSLKKHKQTHLPADQRLRKPKVHHCDHGGCNYKTDQKSNLKKHKQRHLPADQRPKMHQCAHKGCNYRSNRADHLKKHKWIHLPADQRAKKTKVHKCDFEGCNYSTDRTSSLKRHKQTHLPADQRPKRKACDQPPSNAKRKKGDSLPTCLKKASDLPPDFD